MVVKDIEKAKDAEKNELLGEMKIVKENLGKAEAKVKKMSQSSLVLRTGFAGAAAKASSLSSDFKATKATMQRELNEMNHSMRSLLSASLLGKIKVRKHGLRWL